jgi:hypothetical protein
MRSGRTDPRIFNPVTGKRQVVSRFTSGKINSVSRYGEMSECSCMDRNPYPKSNPELSAYFLKKN